MDPLKVGQRIKAIVTSDTRNKYFQYPVTGELEITELSVSGEIITANLYPNGPTGGFGSVTWPTWHQPN